MSVKFEKETIRDTPIPGQRKVDFAHEVGERLTGGESSRGYLAVSSAPLVVQNTTHPSPQVYLKQLQTDPLRTKMLTSGSLAAIQEVLASWIAHDRSKHGHYVSSRVPKMAVYGAFISAPMGHFLISILQKVFAGRTSLRAKILQILVSNLIVCGSPKALDKTASKLTVSFADCADTEHNLPRLNGCDRRRTNVSSDPCYSQSRLYACHES